MTQRLTPATASLLVLPPMLWAGNAVVGRLVNGLVPPITLNFLRWALAFVLLLPLAAWVVRRAARSAACRPCGFVAGCRPIHLQPHSRKSPWP